MVPVESDALSIEDSSLQEHDTVVEAEEQPQAAVVQNCGSASPKVGEPQLRRSTRTTAGQHSNLHHLPVSSVQQEIGVSHVDPAVLSNISQTQLLLVQMLAGVKSQQ